MVWKVINESLNKNENNKQINIPTVLDKHNNVVVNNQDIVNEFNTFFTTVGKNIANNIKTKHTDHLKYLCNENNPKFLFFELITKEEIKNYKINSKNNTSFYRNGLSNVILKQILDYILVPLEHIFDLALVTGTFPNTFK
jgi:hypothetical protein